MYFLFCSNLVLGSSFARKSRIPYFMHVLYVMIFSVGQTLLWLPRNPTLSRAQSKLKNNLETPQPLSKRTLLSFCKDDLLVV